LLALCCMTFAGTLRLASRELSRQPNASESMFKFFANARMLLWNYSYGKCFYKMRLTPWVFSRVRHVCLPVDCVWNVMAHAQKSDFVFRRNGRVHLNRRGRQFSRLLAAEVCASAVVMLDTPCSEVVWSVLATHSIRQFPLHFPSRASLCAISFELDSTSEWKELGSQGKDFSIFQKPIQKFSRFIKIWQE